MNGASDSRTFVAPTDPRVQLAAERTLLAWVRTGLSLMGFGFVVARFGLFLHELAAGHGEPVHSRGGSLWIGVALVALGVMVLVVSASRYRVYSATLSEGRIGKPPGALFGIAVTLVLAAAGVAMVAYLLSIGL
jgi:putative membrane protein